MELCGKTFSLNNRHNCWGKLKLLMWNIVCSTLNLLCFMVAYSYLSTLARIVLGWFSFSMISRYSGHCSSHATCCIQNVFVPRQPHSNLHVGQQCKSTAHGSAPVTSLKILVKALRMLMNSILINHNGQDMDCVLNFSWNIKLIIVTIIRIRPPLLSNFNKKKKFHLKGGKTWFP